MSQNWYRLFIPTTDPHTRRGGAQVTVGGAGLHAV